MRCADRCVASVGLVVEDAAWEDMAVVMIVTLV